MFTAAGLVMLAEEGKVDLQKPIGDCVRDLHPSIARLTAHQLLTHTAGLSDPNAMNGPHDETALGTTVRSLGPRDFFDEPGRLYSYANPGYWIAGLVVQEVSGKLYADHLTERVFRPLGMTRTTFRPTMAMTWPFAVGHSPEGRGEAKVIRPLADNAGVWPAGQMFSSAPEFARFCIAFMNGGLLDGKTVLSRHVIEQLSAPHVKVPMDDRHYGYGLSVRDEGGLRWLSHTGSRTGYGSIAKLCPEKQFAVIILCNKTGHNLPRSTAKAVQLVLGIEPEREPPRRPVPMTDAEMQRYAGTYTSGRATIRLVRRDGQLLGEPGGVVQKVGDLQFLRAPAGSMPELSFSLWTNSTGEITHLLQRGRALKRVTPANGAPAKK
jgi:CubicO group peptidase (beta-lactamase class C family)